jgi:hypothetical protein
MRLELRLFEDEINRSSVLRGSVLVSTATMLFSTMMQQKLASEEAE